MKNFFFLWSHLNRKYAKLLNWLGMILLNVIENMKIENRHVWKPQNRQQICEGSTVDMWKLNGD